jgi:hypothetical protein
MKSFMPPEKQSNIILLCQVCDHRPGPLRLRGADNLAELRTVSAHEFRPKRIQVRLLPSHPFCPSPVLLNLGEGILFPFSLIKVFAQATNIHPAR